MNKFNALAKQYLKEKVLPFQPGTIEELVDGYYKLLKALRGLVKQKPEFAYNEDALKSTDVYQELAELIESQEFQNLVSCGIETYMHGDTNAALQDVLKGN